MTQATIGIIGTGHIAAPIVRFLAARGHPVLVSERNSDIATQLAQKPEVHIADNQAVLDGADIVFLCLRPQIAAPVLAGLEFRATQQVVSVMAGISFDQLRGICAPAERITMTIPLGFVEQGGCPLAAFPNAGPLIDLFAPENPIFPVSDEAAFNQHFAICAMVPGLLGLMADGADWLGRSSGDAGQAERYTIQLVAGFLAALGPVKPGRLAGERDALATEGTISLQMVQALRDGGANATLIDALGQIGARLAGPN